MQIKKFRASSCYPENSLACLVQNKHTLIPYSIQVYVNTDASDKRGEGDKKRKKENNNQHKL